MACYQLYFIILNFTSNPFSTVIELGYSQLDFPTVTVCNLNPIRLNKLDSKSDMYTLVDSLRPNSNNNNNGNNNDPSQTMPTVSTAQNMSGLAGQNASGIVGPSQQNSSVPSTNQNSSSPTNQTNAGQAGPPLARKRV